MRDHWNNVEVEDEDKLVEECVAIIKAAGKVSYAEYHNLRISAELCDRSHFKNAFDVLAAKSGQKAPKELDIILEDPDFDVRVEFMKKVVAATDPAPAGVRAKHQSFITDDLVGLTQGLRRRLRRGFFIE